MTFRQKGERTRKVTSARPMGNKQRSILRTVKQGLVEDMDPEEVLLKMTDTQVFTTRDEAEIKANPTREKKCEKFLEILPRKGAKAYDSFITALKGHQPHLANLILEAENNSLKAEVKTERMKSAKAKRDGKKSLAVNAECKRLKDQLQEGKRKLSDAVAFISQLQYQLQEVNQTCSQCHKMEEEINDLKSKIDQLTLEQGNERKAWEEKMESKDKLIEGYKNEITAISLAKENQTKPKERCLKENLASATTSEMINTLSTTNKALETERDQLKQELEECKRLQENSVSRVFLPSGDAFVGTCSGVICALKRETAATLSATRSSDKLGKASNIFDHQTGTESGTEEKKDSWWSVDLGCNHRLVITHYDLRHGKKGDELLLSYWQLEGSTDASHWETLETKREKNNHFQPTHPFYTGRWIVEGKRRAFRHFRIFQTRRNESSGKYGIFLSGIELYGVLFEIKEI